MYLRQRWPALRPLRRASALTVCQQWPSPVLQLLKVPVQGLSPACKPLAQSQRPAGSQIINGGVKKGITFHLSVGGHVNQVRAEWVTLLSTACQWRDARACRDGALMFLCRKQHACAIVLRVVLVDRAGTGVTSAGESATTVTAWDALCGVPETGASPDVAAALGVFEAL